MVKDMTNTDKEAQAKLLESIIIILEIKNVDPETIELIRRIKQA